MKKFTIISAAVLALSLTSVLADEHKVEATATNTPDSVSSSESKIKAPRRTSVRRESQGDKNSDKHPN